MVDEQDLRDLADELRHLYRELDALKYAPPAPREARVMKPRPGPSTPGNWLAMALDRDMTADLFEMVRDAANHVDPTAVIHHHGQWLCEWIKLKSFYIAADFPAALELHELMTDQARRLNKRLHPPGTDQVANRPEPRQYAPAICQRLAGMGHRVTPDTLRAWASRSSDTPATITTEQRGTKNTYLLTEVLDFIRWRSDQRKHHAA